MSELTWVIEMVDEGSETGPEPRLKRMVDNDCDVSALVRSYGHDGELSLDMDFTHDEHYVAIPLDKLREFIATWDKWKARQP